MLKDINCNTTENIRRQKQPKCPSRRGWVNKLQYIDTVEGYEAFTKYLIAIV